MFGSKQREAMRYKLANQSVGAGGAEGGGRDRKPNDYLWSTVSSQRGFDTEYNTGGVL